MPQYTNGALTLTDSVPADVHVKVTNVDMSANAEVTGDDSGSLYEETLSLTGFAPVANFTSKAIATILGLIGLDGECVSDAHDITVVDIINRKLETCEAALGGTPHMRYRIDTGILRLATLDMPRNQDATISVTLDAFTDGTNAPVAETDGVAMVTPLVNERFRLGLCKVAGVQFPDNAGMSIEYNVGLTDKTPAFGSIWADSAGVVTVRPVLVMRGRDLAKVKSGLIELGATAAAHADTTIQLIKLLDSGSFQPLANAVHIKFTVAGLAVPESIFSSSAGGNATNEIRIPLMHDGTNAPIVNDLAIAYDTTP